jgi:hypothetical protein
MYRIRKYGRAFDWRLSKARQEGTGFVAKALVDLSRREQLEVFEDYLYLSRKRHKNRMALAKLQLHLVEELVVAQKAIKYYRAHKEKLSLALPEAKEDEKKQIEADLEEAETGLFFHRHFANCIRLIGDGIAWRSLGYDRTALRFLSQRSTKQEVVSEGFEAELAAWSRTFDYGSGLAIYNALTNWIAYGDITVVKDDGSVEIVEVKSSNTKSRRLTRQKQGMNEVVELLNAGEGEDQEKQQVSVLVLDVEPENGLRQVMQLIQEASRRGFAADSISNFLYVECVDFRSAGDFETLKTAMSAAREQHLKAWEDRNDVFLPMESADFLAFGPNCAPFSVFPFPEEICVGLMTGTIIFTSFLNQSEVAREFERRGWQITLGPEQIRREVEERHKKGEEAEIDQLLKVKKNGFSASVPPAEFTRLTMEALRPKVLIKARELVRAMGPEGTKGSVLFSIAREHEVWR